MLADTTSSSYYNSKVFNNEASGPKHRSKIFFNVKVISKLFDNYKSKFVNFSKNYTIITLISKLNMKLKAVLTNDIFKISTNMIYYILLNALVAFKYFTPHL